MRVRPVRAAAICTALLAACVLVVPVADPPFPDVYGTVVLDTHGEVLHTYLAADEQRRFRLDLQDISPKLVTAVLTAEDRRFPQHPGVDPLALGRAVVQNLRAGEVRSGASTITMQVARLMRPKPRTIPNKLLEMAQALKIETRLDKAEILRLYLEHAPYGGNLVGVTAASLHYFGRPANRLTWAEAATLGVLPKAPATVTPFRNSEVLLERRNRLLNALHREGAIDGDTLRDSLREDLPTTAHSMPTLAPHAARRVVAAFPGRNVRTTIDRGIQEQLEALARRHAVWLSRRGIHNLSILAVETSTGRVRAYIGSPDFFDRTHGGQVDGVTASRSTGSLLKPFLYAQAFDLGTIQPESLLRDVPVYFGSYAPVNADRGFSGMVRASEALVRSLNVPPTLLLREIGVARFHNLLRRAGMSTLFRSPDGYGLSLILGGAEGTLWDMVRLYRGLARDGRFDGLTLIAGRASDEGPQLLSPSAARITMEILTEVRRPVDDGVDRTLFEPRRPVAWKTGTSFGKRDAWAVGVTPDWVVGVWVGNFSGQGKPSLGGARTAAPILFAAFDLLPGHREGGWFGTPADVRDVRLCRASGYRAGDDCPETVIGHRPRRAPPVPVCPFHRGFWIDPESGFEVCSRCWRASERRRIIRLIFPADAAQMMRRAGHRIDSPPPHNPDCPVSSPDRPLRIVYPAAGITLLVPRDLDGRPEPVTLRAAHVSASAALHWYVDGAYCGRTTGEHAMSLLLGNGNHRVEIIDNDGRSASATFTVERRG
ncbi:MAG: penicillin-binding protein 1C [Thermoanaerobaculales bacterium]